MYLCVYVTYTPREPGAPERATVPARVIHYIHPRFFERFSLAVPLRVGRAA